MEDVKHRLHEAFKSTVEFVTPARSVTGFREKGVLTPDEFVLAGDNLVEKCPTWAWEGGDPGRRKSYLPSDKQYIITRNVPCLRRAGAIGEAYNEDREVLVDSEADGGWLATHGVDTDPQSREDDVPSMDASDVIQGGEIDDNDRDVPDMEAFEDEAETDVATLHSTYLVAREPDDDNILRTRTYDLTITYDKYYQTPRVWLFGYDEFRQPLAAEQVFEDVSQDHAKKTVTIDDHPHLSGKFASVHPCRHSFVMKKIFGELAARGGEPRVDQYLIIFLKFIASIVPTIEYDYTMEFALGPGRNS